MDHQEKAESLFLSGYNCAQAVLMAYKDELNLDEQAMLRMTSSLGGGMGGMREICGAVNAMFLVMGIMCGPNDPTDGAAKAQHYEVLNQMAGSFQTEHGALRCADLLKALEDELGTAPAPRTKAYYATRPCARLVGYAARLIENRLAPEAAHKNMA